MLDDFEMFTRKILRFSALPGASPNEARTRTRYQFELAVNEVKSHVRQKLSLITMYP